MPWKFKRLSGMSGNKYILDTNAIVALLKADSSLINLTENAEWIGISIISYIEFLAFPDLGDEDISLFKKFAERIDVVGLHYNDKDFLEMIISFRKKYKIKLPDSIIISTAFINNASLITSDKQLSNVKEVNIVSF